MEFKYYNPNPDAQTFKSGKPKSWNNEDSSIRSICCATNKEWLTVFDDLCKIARNNHDMIDSKKVIDIYLQSNNFTYETYGKPRVGEKRPTIEEFANDHNTGIYILYLRDYYVCIIDGNLYNTLNMTKDSVYSYWKLN